MRRATTLGALFLLACLALTGLRAAERDWTVSGGDPGAQRYSTLTQITPANVAGLTEAWTFDTGSANLQVTPLVVGGVMYLTAGDSVFALEPETGMERWQFTVPEGVVDRCLRPYASSYLAEKKMSAATCATLSITASSRHVREPDRPARGPHRDIPLAR